MSGEYDPSLVIAEAGGADVGGDFVMDSGHFMSNLGGRKSAMALAGAGGILGGLGGAMALDVMPAMASQPNNGEKVKVVQIKAKAVGFSNKLEKCFAKAEKKEQPAPPVDPYAECEGDVTVNVVARAVAKCRKGWMGGRAAARASVREKIHVSAWARSIASGDAEAEAKTRIRDRVKTKASASVNCVRIKGDKPETPDTPDIPTTPTTPTTPSKNQPPTGVMTPPQHRYVKSEGPVCVDNISDPDGDAVTASNFDFENTNGQNVGQVLSGVFTMPGTNGETQCVRWKAPEQPMQVTASADLSDGRGGQSQVMNNFPVIPEQL